LQFLALGDSIAFGYDPTVTDPTNPSNFAGYPDAVAQNENYPDSNAACPGETSGSFLNTSAPDNGCQKWRGQFPLHVSYDGSQMAYAEAYLQANQGTRYITFNMGANDLFLLQNSCTTDAGLDSGCVASGLPGVISAYQQNVTTIYTNLQAAGFTGALVALTTYATDYSNTLSVSALSALNSALSQVTTQFGYKVADGFQAFKEASNATNGDACAAGLLIKLPDGTCNIHPSTIGCTLLAGTIEGALPFLQ
jgi:lysophospholipase L1-like esterase